MSWHRRSVSGAGTARALAGRRGRKGPTCIAVASSNRPITVNINVGTVLPMTVTAQGKLWLAAMDPAERASWLDDRTSAEMLGLDAVRAAGYARNRGDNEPYIGALAVPVLHARGGIALTLSVFGMVRRFDDAMIAATLPKLRDIAARLMPDRRSGPRRHVLDPPDGNR